MSLFERLQDKRFNLQERKVKKSFPSGSFDPANQEGKFVKNEAGKNLNKTNNREINKRLSASTTKGDQARSQYNVGDGSTIGTPEGTTATKTKTVKQSEVSKQAKEFTKKINKKRTGSFDDVTGEGKVKYPKTRKELIAKRKEYGIDRKGNISDAGVKRYAQKTKELSSGSNLPVTPTQKELDLAKKRAVGGTPIKNKAGKVIGTTTGKYGGKLSRKRPSNAPSLAQIKAKIDAKNPTYKSPLTGGQLPNIGSPASQVKKLDSKLYKDAMKLKGKGGIPKWMKDFDKEYPDKSKLGDIQKSPKGSITEPKMPKTILKKQKYFKGQKYPGFQEIDTGTKAGRKFYQQQVETGRRLTSKQLTGEPTKPLTRFQKIKKAVTTGWKIPKETGNFIEKTRGAGKNITKTFTRKYYKPNIVGTIAKNLDKVPNRYKAIAAAGLIGYGLIGRNKTAKADDKKGSTGVATSKPKVMKYTSPNTTLNFGGSQE